MPAVSSLITSLKKNRNQLAKLGEDATKRVERLVLEFDTLIGVAERVKEVWTEKINKEKALSKELAQLQSEHETRMTSKETLNLMISTKRQDLEIAEKTLRSVEMELADWKRKLELTEGNLRDMETSIQRREQDNQAREKELASLQGDQEDLMVYLDREINTLQEEHAELASKYWALRYLLREEMLSTPEAKIIKVLERKKSSSIEELEKETYLTRFRVEKAVKQLNNLGLLRIETEGGKLTILKPVKIEP